LTWRRLSVCSVGTPADEPVEKSLDPAGKSACATGPNPMAERKSFLMRIDPALWADLEAWAQDELRSVNGQIEYLLRQAVQRRKSGTGTKLPETDKPQ